VREKIVPELPITTANLEKNEKQISRMIFIFGIILGCLTGYAGLLTRETIPDKYNFGFGVEMFFLYVFLSLPLVSIISAYAIRKWSKGK
jgi:hypothetical protein